MRTLKETICCIFVLTISAAASTTGTNYTVKAGGGGNYTTIQSCANAMAAGDTCTVFAGTYKENVTVSAGTSGNYKTITVNGSDVVIVTSFTLNSHTKLIGNCPTPNYPTSIPSAGSCGFSLGTTGTNPVSSSACVSMSDGTTDVYISNNVMFGCNGSSVVMCCGSRGVSYVYVQGNTMSYSNWNPNAGESANNGTAIDYNGNHVLIEKNDFSHFGLAVQTFGQYTVIRNNTFHDNYESECGPSSGNCHLDIIYAERSVLTASQLVQYNLWEGNVATNSVGPDAKGLWTAGDDVCTPSYCFDVIGRFNVLAHFGSGAMAQTSGFGPVKYYNNSIIDGLTSFHGSPGTVAGYVDTASTSGGSIINNLYYFPFTFPQTWGWYAYSLNSGATSATFTAGGNFAYCSGTPCGIQARSGLFASDSPVIAPNILDTTTDPLVNYSGGDFDLAAGSPALNAGTHLTTVATADSGSGTSLVVSDAGFFQDGLGLNAAGVQADCISVTTVTNHVCITAVNYATNTLTLASGIARSPGDPVWLYSDSKSRTVLTGSAPNIGATFVSGGGGGTPPSAPTGLSAVVN
jgi:hypothetical protein